MAKPDWGELQQRFLSEHATTGVSPKEWCEARGLNYATARRYIKKPSAQTAQKPVQKKMRTAQKDKSANELVDDDGLKQCRDRLRRPGTPGTPDTVTGLSVRKTPTQRKGRRLCVDMTTARPWTWLSGLCHDAH